MLQGISGTEKQNPVHVEETRSRAPKVSERPPARPAGSPRQEPRRPWDGQPDFVACNFAVANLSRELPARLQINGRVHAETCLAAIGAIAGFTAQHALLSHLKQTSDVATLKQLQTISTIGGDHYFFGEPLNRTLLPLSRADAEGKLWSLAAGGAIAAGLHPSHLPAPQQIFVNVVNTLGSKREGMPSVPERHAPAMRIKPLLQHVWPLAMMCVTGRLPDDPRKYGVPTLKFWPAIAAHAASSIIRQAKTAVDPKIGLILVMESAIYASKLSSGLLKTA